MIIYGKAPAFHRPQRRPDIWGPPSAVQASVFKRAEKKGINPASIFALLPHWEGAGSTVMDYAKNQSYNVALHSWKDGKLNFSDQNGQGYLIPRTPQIPAGSNFLVLMQGLRVYYTGGAVNASLFNSSNNGYGISSRIIDWSSTISFSASSNFVGTSLSDAPGSGYYNYCFTRTAGQDLSLYRDGRIVNTGVKSGLLTPVSSLTYFGIGRLSSTSSNADYNGGIGLALVLIGTDITPSICQFLADNPYYLIQRQAPVYYSIPSTGGGPSTGSVSGPLSFSGGLTRTVNYHRLLSGAI